MSEEKIVDTNQILNINENKENQEDNLTSWGEKKIELDWLISKYNSFKSDEAKKVFLEKTIKTVTYTNFEVVCGYADIIIAQSMFNKNGDILMDSCKKYLLYIYTLIAFYTNINVHANGWTKEFNSICRYGLLDKIIKLIPESEIATLDAVLEMKTGDVNINYYNMQNWLTKKLGDFYPYIVKIIDEFLKVIENNIKDLDEKKIQSIIKNLNEINGSK